MKRKESVAIPGLWPETVKTAWKEEKTGNQKLLLILLLVFIVSNPFFLSFLATWVFWLFKSF